MALRIKASRSFKLRAWWAYEGNICEGCQNWKVFPVHSGTKLYRIDLGHVGDIKGVRLSFLGQPGQVSFEDIQLLSRHSPEYEENISQRKVDPVYIEKVTDEHVIATIDLLEERIVFFAIPYDKGWHAKIDGVDHPLKRVNLGFSGLVVPEGEHSLELKFRPPFLVLGAIVSLLSLIVTVLFYAYQTRKKCINEKLC